MNDEQLLHWEKEAFVKLARLGAIVFLPTAKGKYLLQRDSEGPNKGKLRPLGGGKDTKDQNLQQTIVREMHEEFAIPRVTVRRKVKFLGYEYRPEFKGNAIFELKDHGLLPGTYQASNDPDEQVTLEEASLDDPDYTGPQPEKLQETPEIKEASEGPSDAKLEFTPHLTPEEMHERSDYQNRLLHHVRPHLASQKEWPEHWCTDDSPTGWIEWYEGYHAGKRGPDDKKQIARWHNQAMLQSCQFRRQPTPRRAFAMIHWALDPIKMLPEHARESFQKEMDAYRDKVDHAARRQQKKQAHVSAPIDADQGTPAVLDTSYLEDMARRFPAQEACTVGAGELASLFGPPVKEAGFHQPENFEHIDELSTRDFDVSAGGMDWHETWTGATFTFKGHTGHAGTKRFWVELNPPKELTDGSCPKDADRDWGKRALRRLIKLADEQRAPIGGTTPTGEATAPSKEKESWDENHFMDAAEQLEKEGLVEDFGLEQMTWKETKAYDFKGTHQGNKRWEPVEYGPDKQAATKKNPYIQEQIEAINKKHGSRVRIKCSCGCFVQQIKCTDKLPVEVIAADCDQCAAEDDKFSIDEIIAWQKRHPEIQAATAKSKGHGIVKGSCGHVITQCRCARSHEPVTLEFPCMRCERKGTTKKAATAAPATQPPVIPRTGPEAIAHALAQLDLDKLEAEQKDIVYRRLKSKRPRAVKLLGYIQGLRKTGVAPHELMLTKVPVIPSQFRPFSVAGDAFVPGDANELYRDLINLTKVHKGLEEKLGPGAAFNKLNIYNAVAALYGYGDPTSPKTKERGVTGFLEKVTGHSPKFSYIQRKMLSKDQDYVGRGVVSVDPDLTIDEIGIPEDMAWTLHAPHVQRDLVRHGMSPEQAIEEIAKRGEHASRTLDKVLRERPVIYSRAPAWHKFNAIAGFAKRVKGDNVMVNPLVTTGMNMDFDGDTCNVHAPAMPETVEEAKEKLLPSKMLFSVKDPDKIMPAPKQELILGLHNAQVRPAQRKHTFGSEADALAAIRAGRVSLSDEIEIGAMPKAAKYDPPLGLDKLKAKHPHLLDDPVHRWRAEQGIELIHPEPSPEEQERIWANWQLMAKELQALSDAKSRELFGMTNAEHHQKLTAKKPAE